MYVIVYMVYAEAVVAITSGAVAEIQIGIVCIGPSANGAFVAVLLILLRSSGLFSRLFEIDCLRRIARSVRAQIRQSFVAAYDDEIEYRNEWEQCQDKEASHKTGDHCISKICSIHQRKPFYLYGYNKKQSDLMIRE